MSAYHPARRTGDLHFRRHSTPSARYFITLVTRDRRPGLSTPPLIQMLSAEALASHVAGDATMLALTVMPDHVHWLFQLGSRLSLGRVVARFKSLTKEPMAGAALDWQRDFFEHRLHSDESVDAYARYIFLNPYRAGLVAVNQLWSGWICPHADQMDFVSLLNPDGTPPAAWINEPMPRTLATGE